MTLQAFWQNRFGSSIHKSLMHGNHNLVVTPLSLLFSWLLSDTDTATSSIVPLPGEEFYRRLPQLFFYSCPGDGQ